ncbi:MAG: glycoside hydrolase family 5 protein, partial [Chitinispirillales bacterium]|nr:glycoside hydrolase family 5 protein [Chitinispirillales bacterium]
MDKAIPILSAIAVSAFSAFAGPVEQYGRLYADGSKIVGERSGGSAVQLKGPSLQWSVAGWGSDKFFLTETVDAMAGGWMAQVIRAPLGIAYVNPTDPGDEVTDGYNVDSLGNWERVERVVDAAIERGVYAILDWHSHSAHNADEIALAADFFT